MNRHLRLPAARGTTFLLLLAVAGCTTVPADRGGSEIDRMLAERGVAAPGWPKGGDPSEGDRPPPAEPLSIARAVEVAFARNSEVREAYADLGIAHADVIEARQLFDLNFGVSRLGVSGGPGEQVTRSFSVAFADLLMLPARSRLAGTELERLRNEVADKLFGLAARVEAAWLDCVAAQQVARLDSAAAEIGETAGELATRMHAAGNLSAVEHAGVVANAREARIAALRSAAHERESRVALANLLGLRSDAAWTTQQGLPEVPVSEPVPDSLADAAIASRLDLSGAKRALMAHEQTSSTARRWRWLGDVEVGYERETDPDGSKLSGPTLEIGVPLFHWNRAGVLRAQSELEAARAKHVSLELAVRNEVSLAIANLAAAREVVSHYRDAILPLREKAVAGTFGNYNYMLTDAFELLTAKREQFAVFTDYLEAIAGYWNARAELRVASGGALPAATPTGKIIGADTLLGAADPDAGHHGHGGSP
jgi:outer membrane protein, heavy metal efflux system